MIIYNVTSNVDKTVHDQWLLWVKEHIPQVLSTGCFIEAKLAKVMVDDDQNDTYSIQYRAKTREDLERYYSEFAETFRKDIVKRFGEKVLAFRTELEVIDEYSVKFD